MRVLLYKDLNTRRVKAAFAKVRAAIEADDFRSADVKKLAPTPYWRAKLDYSNRLLLQFARHGDETVCLALEVASVSCWGATASRSSAGPRGSS